MEFHRLKIVLLFMFFPIVLTFGQDKIYRLKSIDSISFKDYYYFEFKNCMKSYVVISEKKDFNFSNDLCLVKLLEKKKYRLNLVRIVYLEVDDFTFGTLYYDLLRVRFKEGDKQFGGQIPVYVCDLIVGNKIKTN